MELWSGPVDWVYCPAEYVVPTRRARRAVTSHDVLQDLETAPAMRGRLARLFDSADLILSVSQFNTERLLEHFPDCRDRVAYVPNAAEDLFFEPSRADTSAPRCSATWACPPRFPTCSRSRTSSPGRT